MDTQVIDAQFDRAVQIVQGLPKTGPIQTGYEEKLAMYSLYKQATVGNVKGTRPAMWDMLGRAKWDAWAKHKDLGSYEAKWQYVDELLRVLRKYSDKTVAQDLVKELEAYEGASSGMDMSASFSKSHDSDSDSDSDEERAVNQRRVSQSLQNLRQQQAEGSDDDESGSDDEQDDQIGTGLRGQPIMSNPNLNQSLSGRPQSSLSTHRYRTPMGSSLVLSPPPDPPGSLPAYPVQSNELNQWQKLQQQRNYVQHNPQLYIDPNSTYGSGGMQPIPFGEDITPRVQPMPGFETPSAFPGPSPPVSSSMPPSAAGLSASGGSSFMNVAHPYPANMYPGHPAYRTSSHHSHSPGQIAGSGQGMVGAEITGSGVRSPLERAVENVQAHLTALQERMDMLEGRSLGGTPFASIGGPSALQGSPRNSYFGAGGRGRGADNSIWTWLTEIDEGYFGWEHMGLWSAVLSPLARITKFLTRVLAFLLARRAAEGSRRKGLSPGLAILRRLLLDASFVLFVAYFGRRVWRRSGVRRREVVHALVGVWGAIVGKGGALPRQLAEKGV